MQLICQRPCTHVCLSSITNGLQRPYVASNHTTQRIRLEVEITVTEIGPWKLKPKNIHKHETTGILETFIYRDISIEGKPFFNEICCAFMLQTGHDALLELLSSSHSWCRAHAQARACSYPISPLKVFDSCKSQGPLGYHTWYRGGWPEGHHLWSRVPCRGGRTCW